MSPEIIARKPLKTLNNSINLDVKGFFVNLARLVVGGVTINPDGVLEGAEGILDSIKSKNTPEQIAWHLISKSVLLSIVTLTNEYTDLFGTQISEESIEEIASDIEYHLNAIDVSIDYGFFESPGTLPLINDFKPVLSFWLKSLGMQSDAIQLFCLRLNDKFALAIISEWASDEEKYSPLKNILTSPFLKFNKEEKSWHQYHSWLHDLTMTRVFHESFSLRQVYVPLRSYYVENIDGKKLMIFDLYEHLSQWVYSFNKENSIKAIRGGPGSGKSTFSKVLAADLVKKTGVVKVLLIPLHHFNIVDDLVSSVNSFVKVNKYLAGVDNPLTSKSIGRLLIIFDGLDELSMQGKLAEEVSQNFVSEVRRLLDYLNAQGLERLAIITGRDLSIQSAKHNFRFSSQVLYILPFYVTEKEKNEIYGRNQLLDHDQRNEWWGKYGKIKSDKYSNSRYPSVIRASQACEGFDFYGHNHTLQALKACPNTA